jgi:GNAT superfamily N-acetyltransferase
MTIEQVGLPALSEYQLIPCSFEVRARVDLDVLAQSGEIVPIAVEPFTKDYDVFEDERPENLPRVWDMRSWSVFLAREGRSLAGGAIVARNEPELGRAILQDLRVAPDYRVAGVGRSLVEFALDWARKQGCSQILVETQDLNVAACRLYSKCGFHLTKIDPNAYEPELREAKLVWMKALCE